MSTATAATTAICPCEEAARPGRAMIVLASLIRCARLDCGSNGGSTATTMRSGAIGRWWDWCGRRSVCGCRCRGSVNGGLHCRKVSVLPLRTGWDFGEFPLQQLPRSFIVSRIVSVHANCGHARTLAALHAGASATSNASTSSAP